MFDKYAAGCRRCFGEDRAHSLVRETIRKEATQNECNKGL